MLVGVEAFTVLLVGGDFKGWLCASSAFFDTTCRGAALALLGEAFAAPFVEGAGRDGRSVSKAKPIDCSNSIF